MRALGSPVQFVDDGLDQGELEQRGSVLRRVRLGERSGELGAQELELVEPGECAQACARESKPLVVVALDAQVLLDQLARASRRLEDLLRPAQGERNERAVAVEAR